MAGNKRSGVTVSDALARFEARLRARNASPKYVKAQCRYVELFAEHLSAQRKYWLAQVDTVTVEEYLYPPDGDGMAELAPSSFNLAVTSLSRFFKWAVQIGLAEYNPFADVARKHHHSKWVPLIMSPVEMIRLLEAAPTARTRALMAVAMNTGLRSVDIFNMKIGNMDLGAGQMSVWIQKVHKYDVKPMTRDLIIEMRRYLDAYARIIGNGMTASDLPNEWALFPAVSPGRIYRFRNPEKPGLPRGQVVTDVLGKLGYPTAREGFHTLRRSSARALFEDLQHTDGRDRALLIVKDFLNHGSVMQTEKYLGLSHERTARNNHLQGQSFLTRMAQQAAEQAAGEGRPGEAGGVREIA